MKYDRPAYPCTNRTCVQLSLMLLCAGLLLGNACAALAQTTEKQPDTITIMGTTYQNPQITTNITSITIHHAAGIRTIAYKDLSEQERQRFGYDERKYQAAMRAEEPPPPPPANDFLAFRKGIVDGITAPARILHVRNLAFLPRAQRTLPYHLGLSLGLFGLFLFVYIAIFVHRKKH